MSLKFYLCRIGTENPESDEPRCRNTVCMPEHNFKQ